MIMKKIYSLLLLTIISVPAFATRGELYAWDELNNTGDTSILSFVFYVILCLFIGIACLRVWLYAIFKGEYTKECNKIGCIGFSFILIIILAIMIRCSFAN